MKSNLTIYRLALSRVMTNTPSMVGKFTSSSASTNLFSSYFNQLPNSVVFSRSKEFFNLQNCRFKNILNSAVDVSGNDPNLIQYSSIIISSQVKFNYVSIAIDHCSFIGCTSDCGGAIQSNVANITLIDNIFEENHARITGGAHLLRTVCFDCRRNLFLQNSAEYSAAIVVDTLNEDPNLRISHLNVTGNSAKMWTGGIRLDHCGGTFTNSVVSYNHASVCGGFFDFSWKPCHRNITSVLFKNNSSVARAGAATAFHILQSATYKKCVFVKNYCKLLPNSISIESIDTRIEIEDCIFDGPRESEIGMKYGMSEFVVNSETVFEANADQILQAENALVPQIVSPRR